jgi:hypothetical protein
MMQGSKLKNTQYKQVLLYLLLLVSWQVNDCRVYNRLDGSEEQYIELLSTQFTSIWDKVKGHTFNDNSMTSLPNLEV